jgi:hypothetical protein
MSNSFKKLWNEYGTVGSITILIIILFIGVKLYNYFKSKGTFGFEKLSQNTNSAYGNGPSNSASGKPSSGQSYNAGVRASEPLGQNEVFASVNGGNTNQAPMKQQQTQNPNDLLPKDNNSQWAQLNPSGKGELANINLLKAGYHIGIDTVGETLRNANLQIRSEPPNPQLNVGPWNLSTIEPDIMRPPLEIGSGPQ